MVHAASLTHINQAMESSGALTIRQSSVSTSVYIPLVRRGASPRSRVSTMTRGRAHTVIEYGLSSAWNFNANQLWCLIEWRILWSLNGSPRAFASETWRYRGSPTMTSPAEKCSVILRRVVRGICDSISFQTWSENDFPRLVHERWYNHLSSIRGNIETLRLLLPKDNFFNVSFGRGHVQPRENKLVCGIFSVLVNSEKYSCKVSLRRHPGGRNKLMFRLFLLLMNSEKLSKRFPSYTLGET